MRSLFSPFSEKEKKCKQIWSDKKESAIHRWTVFHREEPVQRPHSRERIRLGLDPRTEADLGDFIRKSGRIQALVSRDLRRKQL